MHMQIVSLVAISVNAAIGIYIQGSVSLKLLSAQTFEFPTLLCHTVRFRLHELGFAFMMLQATRLKEFTAVDIQSSVLRQNLCSPGMFSKCRDNFHVTGGDLCR